MIMTTEIDVLVCNLGAAVLQAVLDRDRNGWDNARAELEILTAVRDVLKDARVCSWVKEEK